MKKATISDKCFEAYPWMKFGYCLVKNLSYEEQSSVSGTGCSKKTGHHVELFRAGDILHNRLWEAGF
jgi:hypothetical protein